jgi:hypothetical protein
MPEDNKVIENDSSETTSNDSSFDTNESQINIPLNDEESPNNNIKEIQEEFIKKEKKNPLKKILLGVIILLILLIIVGAILYFMGFFKPKEKEIQQNNNTSVSEQMPKEEEYKFDFKDINSKKLNEQLSYLTNKNLNQEKTEEQEKIENEKKLIEEQKKKEEEALKIQEEALLKEKDALEKKKIELENEKAELEALKQEALKVKEELLIKQNQNTDEIPKSQEQIDNPNIELKTEENKSISSNTETTNEDVFLKFINVAKIKGVLYKKYLDKVSSINPNIILCRDDKNRIELYYGPFKSESERKDLLDKLIDNNFEQAYELEFTKEEFDRRCNY